MKFKDSAIDTDTVPKKGEVEAVGADFGELADASSSKQEALGAADEEADILSKSLGGDFVLEDTLVFDTPQADSKAGDSVGASSGTPSCELTVALVSSDKYDTAALIEKLGKNKNVAAVEPNYYINTNSFDDYSLNDEYSSYLYHVNSPAAKNTGGDSVDNRGFDPETALSVNASSGWSKLGGDEKEAVVAVVDSGVNYNHEDLKDVMWVNPGNIGLKGTHGYNFAYKNDDPIDDAGHGTHCAGIIAAQANNGKGVAGIASKANIKIMALKTLAGTFGSSTSYANYGAFNYIHKAVQGGVNVVAVNNSWGGTSYSTIYDDLIDMLGADGVVSVVAAGNDGVDNDNNIYHPANSESDYAVTVGAACMNGKAAAFSNYGKASVDVFAPGVNILSTVSHKSFFPSIYSAQLLNATTEYYGEFNADTKVIDGTVTPSTGVRAESMRTGGSARFNSIADAIGIEQAENALNTGANDADAVFMHENNVMLKMRMPGQKHAADSKVVIDVSEGEELNISDDQKNILQAIAQKTGRTIVLTDKLSENVNGTFAPDGRIYINSKIENSNYGVAVALHEAIHGLRTAAPMEYNALKKFIVNYLVEQGENIDDLLDDIAMRWGDSAASEEARLEELVAQSVMALATDDAALKKAIECEENKKLLNKVLDAIKSIAEKVREFIKGTLKDGKITGAHNKQAQFWTENLKALDELAEKFSKAMDEQRVAVQETTQERNQGGVRYSFGGERARNADKTALATAKQLDADGKSSEEIRQKTGWHKGYDGKWRFEIDDSMAKLVENPPLKLQGNNDDGYYRTAKLGDVLEHSKLFEAYPQLKNVTVIIQETEPGVEGISFNESKQIVLSQKLFERTTEEFKKLQESKQEEIKRIEQTAEYNEYNKYYQMDFSSVETPEQWLKEEKAARDDELLYHRRRKQLL